MLLAMVLTLSSPASAATAEIGRWCAATASDRTSACVARQTEALQRFTSIAAGMSQFERRLAAGCLTKAERGPGVDWRVASGCLTTARNDRLARWLPVDRGTAVNPVSAPPSWTRPSR